MRFKRKDTQLLVENWRRLINEDNVVDSQGNRTNPNSKGRSPGLDEWLRDSVLEKGQEYLGQSCEYKPGDENSVIECDGNQVVSLQVNSIFVHGDHFDDNQLENLLEWMRSCAAVTYEKTYGCNGVYLDKGNLSQLAIKSE